MCGILFEKYLLITVPENIFFAWELVKAKSSAHIIRYNVSVGAVCFPLRMQTSGRFPFPSLFSANFSQQKQTTQQNIKQIKTI